MAASMGLNRAAKLSQLSRFTLALEFIVTYGFTKAVKSTLSGASVSLPLQLHHPAPQPTRRAFSAHTLPEKRAV